MRMRFENDKEIIEQEFNVAEIYVYRAYKGNPDLKVTKRKHRMSTYKTNVFGYKQFLRLKGYQEVKDLFLKEIYEGSK